MIYLSISDSAFAAASPRSVPDGLCSPVSIFSSPQKYVLSISGCMFNVLKKGYRNYQYPFIRLFYLIFNSLHGWTFTRSQWNLSVSLWSEIPSTTLRAFNQPFWCSATIVLIPRISIDWAK